MSLSTILSSDLAVQVIYPFLLVFTLVFAILQKSKILGEDKKQVDSLVALSVALIVIAFSWATSIITELMPFLAVSVVILLVFMILYGFVASDKDKGLELHKNVKNTIGVIIVIVLVIALIVSSGQWDVVYNQLFVRGEPSDIFSSILLLVIVIGALAVVVWGGGKDKNSNDKE